MITMSDVVREALRRRARDPRRYVIRAGISADELTKWQERHPNVHVPERFLSLWTVANGVRVSETFIGDTACGDAFQIFPLGEVKPATEWVELGLIESEVEWLVVGDDGMSDIVLDLRANALRTINRTDIHDIEVLALSVEELAEKMMSVMRERGSD